MENFLFITLIFHIAAGMTALVAGFMAIISKKGMARHKKSGVVYFRSMVLVLASAIIIAVFKEIIFLLAIAIFSFYLVYTGFSAIYLPKKYKPQLLHLTHWPVMILAGICALAMIGFSAVNIFSGKAGLYIVLLVFGIFLLLFVIVDLVRIIKSDSLPKGEHILLHISRMGGAYIATFTAFFVVNVQFEPVFLPWLMPTIIGSPLIAVAITR